MNYQIRKAHLQDMARIEAIYEKARLFMAEHGNGTQWGTVYPPRELLMQDIAQEKLYAIWDECGIHGVFYFSMEADPTYADIWGGCWHSENPYGVIHRIAGDGSGAIVRTAVEFALKKIAYLRIDTHEKNAVMRSALEKQGFRRCGFIRLQDGSWRIAYDLLCGPREAENRDMMELLHLYLHLHETKIPENNSLLKDTWKQIMEDQNHHLVVYEVAGKLVSSCVCVVIPNLTRGLRPYAFIENVVTHRDHRGKGYASACLDYAKQIAREAGCYKLMLLTGSKEKRTLDFYQNAGYNSSDKTAFIQWLDI